MIIRTGIAHTTWRLVVDGYASTPGGNTMPSGLSGTTRAEIAQAIREGAHSGEITQQVLYPDDLDATHPDMLRAQYIDPDPDDPRRDHGS